MPETDAQAGSGPVTDVLVAGAGAAGLAAAVSAAEAGARVLVLERLGGLEGTTSYSVGSLAAAGTRLQSHAGIADSAEAFNEDILLTHPRAAEPAELRELLARQSGPAVGWLEEMGVVFVGPYPEPPNRVPRMHNAVPNGRAYLSRLSRRALALGVEIRFGCQVTGLILRHGSVVGLRYRVGSREDIALASRGVIIAMGDFSGSDELRAKWLSAGPQKAIPINARSRGEGHQLLEEAGAEMSNMDMVFGPQLRLKPRGGSAGWLDRVPDWPWLRRLMGGALEWLPRAVISAFLRQLLIAQMSPAEALFSEGAVLVDSKGRRCGITGKRVDDLLRSDDPGGYVLSDRRLADKFSVYPYFVSTAPGIAYAYFRHYERARPDLVHWTEDLGEVAQHFGMQEEALAEAGRDLLPPYFLFGPVFPMLTVTEGGARIDARCRVLRRDGSWIGGLYAAGGTGQGGLTLKGHGLHLTWAIVSGRIAGTTAAAAPLVEV